MTPGALVYSSAQLGLAVLLRGVYPALPMGGLRASPPIIPRVALFSLRGGPPIWEGGAPVVAIDPTLETRPEVLGLGESRASEH